MFHWMPQLVETSFIILKIFSNIGLKLIGRAGYNNIVFGSSHTV